MPSWKYTCVQYTLNTPLCVLIKTHEHNDMTLYIEIPEQYTCHITTCSRIKDHNKTVRQYTIQVWQIIILYSNKTLIMLNTVFLYLSFWKNCKR